MYIVAGAAIDGAGLQCLAPHLLVGHAMRADKSDSVELVRELADIVHVGEIEIEDNGIGAVTADDVLHFIEVAGDAHVLEIRVQFCCEVFGHNAIRLRHNDIVWIHDSLSFTAPNGGG